MKNEVFAVVLAGGRGVRFGSAKQFVRIKGKTILEYSLEVFEKHERIKEIVLVLPLEFLGIGENLAKRFAKIKKIVKGGNTRQESSKAGIFAIEREGIVLIHDAARPNISEDLVSRVAEAAEKHGAAIPVIPVRDTIIKGENGFVQKTLARQGLFSVQTPQGFKISLIKSAHLKAKAQFSDDAGLFIATGMGKVALVEGEAANFKITYPPDIKMMEYFLT